MLRKQKLAGIMASNTNILPLRYGSVLHISSNLFDFRSGVFLVKGDIKLQMKEKFLVTKITFH